MHYDDNPTGDRSPAEEDQLTETAVVMSVFDPHPAQLTVFELIRELTLDSRRFADHDRIVRAIERLVSVGLLWHQGDSLIATRAADYLWWLVS